MIWNKLECIKYINTLKDDAIVEVKQKQKKSIRSLAQNRYFWGYVVDIIADFHWLTPIATYEMIKNLFKVTTFTDISTKEFSFVMETIIELWKKEYWVRIPLPHDSWMDKSLYESLGF